MGKLKFIVKKIPNELTLVQPSIFDYFDSHHSKSFHPIASRRHSKESSKLVLLLTLDFLNVYISSAIH